MIVGCASTGIAFLRFDFSPEQVYGGQQEAVAFCEAHKELFRFEDSIAILLLESTDGRSLLREETLQWMRRLGDEARKLDGVIDVSSLVTLETPRANVRTGALRWNRLFTESQYGDADYLNERLKRLPLLNDLLISSDRQLTLTLVSLDPGGRDIDTTRSRIARLSQLLDQLASPDGTRVSLSGIPTIRVDVIRSLMTDLAIMTPLSGALFLIISMFMYRSLRVTVVSLTAVVAAVGLTMGLMGWLGMTFSLLSNVVPTLVLIIGAANCVHIVGRLQILLRQQEDSTVGQVKRVMREMSKTCLLTLSTTAIGFGSLLLARSELLQLLGLQSALGMACNYLCLMSVLCPGLMLTAQDLKPPGYEQKAGGNPSKTPSIWDFLGSFVTRYAVLIVVVHLVLAAAALAASMELRVNSYMFETYDTDHPVVQVTKTLDARMSGLVSLEVQLSAADYEKFFTGSMAAASRRVRSQLDADPDISFTRDYIQLLSSVDRRVLSDDSAEAEAALRRVQRMLPRIDRPELTSAFLAEDKHKARLMVRVRDIGSDGFKRLFAKVSRILERELPDGVAFQLTGDVWLHALCMDQFVRDLFHSLLAASGVIFVLIGLLFRSVRAGLISAIPNLFPLTMTLGYMYLRGYQLTAGNVIVFAISLGIAVDDTIHFLARYREEAQDGTPARTAVTQALHSSGRAIVLTSFLVVSGLSVLIFSQFLPTRRFSELTAVTMFAALPGDVILLPALLVLLRRHVTFAGHNTDENRAAGD